MANFPETRLRRLRINQKMRDLVQEVSISPKDLICPVFVEEGIEAKKQINSMPAMERLPLSEVVNEVKKIISFVECYGSSDMEKVDYASVIEYFYRKYGRNITHTAKALGISTGTAKKYLVAARLSDKVRSCIEKKEFSINIAMNALMALGDDEESVDDDMLIETARLLNKIPPVRRMEVVKKIQKNPEITVEEVNEKILTPTVLQFELTSEYLDMIEKYRVEKKLDSLEEAAMDAMDEGLFAARDE